MNSEKLHLLIQERENLTLEFKEKYTSKIDEDIVAFANTKGGRILLGVDDAGTVVGEILTNDMKARIHQLARQCDPSIVVSVEQVDQVVVVSVEERDDKPYRCGTGYFRRIDGGNQKMSQAELRLLFDENDVRAYEERINSRVSEEDVDEEKLKRFLQDAQIRVANQTTMEILESLRLAEGVKVKNVGVLLFARNLRDALPQARLTLLYFKGTNKVEILDRREVVDDVYTQFNQAILFLRSHLSLRSKIEGTRREDQYEIPLAVWREAIANAIIHRDYSVRGTDITIEIFSDRVTITNPGALPRGLTKRQFGRISIRRNELLADMFYRLGIVERAGTGIQRMQQVMKDAGLLPPEFNFDNFFEVTLYRKAAAARKIHVTTELSTNQENILQLLTKTPSLTQAQLAERINITPKNIRNNINKLKTLGLLKREGGRKQGIWIVTESHKWHK
jgi:ATP-dependent DNA helicase RecG